MENPLKKPVSAFVFIFGVVFLLVGLLGFVNNPVLGLFEVNTIHNFVHLLSGAVLVVGSMYGTKNAKLSALVIGVIYGLVTVLGFIALGFGLDGTTDLLGLVHLNGNDNYLHLVLTALAFVLAFLPEGFMSTGAVSTNS